MTSPQILDFETLLAPIAGANPAGIALTFTDRKKLDEKRKDINPKDFAANDPRRPEVPQPADWSGIERLTKEILARTSKDFLVAARLTEALVKGHGFRGLRDGLRLMRRLTQECWDWVHPVIEDGNLEARASAFDWLDDELFGARFPYTVRTAPLTKTGDEQDYGWQHWKDAQEARGAVTGEAFDKAVAATPREYCQTVVDDIGESAIELKLLGEVLSKHMGEAAPGLTQVRKAVLECQELAQQILQRKGPPPVSAPEVAAPPGDSGTAGQPAAASAARRPLTRDDVLARLADASKLLLQMEPHSPVAYLVQRAVKLAQLPLPDLMRVLIRDPGVLGQLDRDLDLGLEKQEAAKQEAAKGGKSK
jgi:type VI secretion system protein ImpA